MVGALRPGFLILALCSCSRPPQPVRDPSHPDLRLEQVAIRSWSGDTLTPTGTPARDKVSSVRSRRAGAAARGSSTRARVGSSVVIET